MNTHRGRSVRRIGVLGAMGISVVLVVASMAFACTTPEGSTFFTDGKTSKTVARGQRISVFATGAHPGTTYKLVLGSNGPHPTHACMQTDFVVNDNVVALTGDQFIGSHSGPAGDLTMEKKTYQVCFREHTKSDWATSAAAITLI